MVTFCKRSTLPAAVKGKAGSLSVQISNNGQMTLSSLATKALEGATHVAIGYESKKGLIFLPTAPLVVKGKLELKDMIELRKAKKGGTVSFSAAAVLRDTKTFIDYVYDFKNSGNQTFAITIDEKNKVLSFDLPNGALTPKVVTPRVRKPKPPTSIRAEAGSTEEVQEEELKLDVA